MADVGERARRRAEAEPIRLCRRARCTGSRDSSRRRSGRERARWAAPGPRRSPTSGRCCAAVTGRPAIGPRAGIPLRRRRRRDRPARAPRSVAPDLGGVVTVRSYEGEGHDVQYRHWDQVLVRCGRLRRALAHCQDAPQDSWPTPSSKPTIAAVTAGCASVQAMASAPGGRPPLASPSARSFA